MLVLSHSVLFFSVVSKLNMARKKKTVKRKHGRRWKHQKKRHNNKRLDNIYKKKNAGNSKKCHKHLNTHENIIQKMNEIAMIYYCTNECKHMQIFTEVIQNQLQWHEQCCCNDQCVLCKDDLIYINVCKVSSKN